MIKRLLILAFLLPSCMLCQSENSAERTKRDFLQLGLTLYEGNEVTILPTAEIKFRDLFDVIEGAEKYILLDYFKFQQDSICSVLLEKLRRKVQQGVEVKIIFDSFGNHDSDFPLSDTLQAQIRDSGIGIKAFDPVRFPWINHLLHRNHHKIAIIDGKTVYTGGMNVADYYLHGKPKVGKWRDMHIRMEGPIVQAYEELFWKMWEKGEKVKKTILHSLLFTLHYLSPKGRAGRGPSPSPAVGPRSHHASCDRLIPFVSIMPTASCKL